MDKVPLDDNLPEDKNVKPPVKSSTLVVIAFTQILLGGILIYAGIVAINNDCYYFDHLCVPTYGGVLVIITGLIGIVSALKKTDQMTLTSLVFSFLSATFCAVTFAKVISVTLDSEDDWRYLFSEICWDKDRNTHDETCQKRDKLVHKKQAVYAFIMMLTLCEGVVAFTNGILCSQLLCCRWNKGCYFKAN